MQWFSVISNFDGPDFSNQPYWSDRILNLYRNRERKKILNFFLFINAHNADKFLSAISMESKQPGNCGSSFRGICFCTEIKMIMKSAFKNKSKTTMAKKTKKKKHYCQYQYQPMHRYGWDADVCLAGKWMPDAKSTSAKQGKKAPGSDIGKSKWSKLILTWSTWTRLILKTKNKRQTTETNSQTKPNWTKFSLWLNLRLNFSIHSIIYNSRRQNNRSKKVYKAQGPIFWFWAPVDASFNASFKPIPNVFQSGKKFRLFFHSTICDNVF